MTNVLRQGLRGGAARGAWRAAGVLLVALAILSACGQGGRQLAGNVAGRVVTGTNAGAGLAGSELVNGNTPTKHVDDLQRTVDELGEPERTPPPKRSHASASGGSSDGGFKPWMCKQGGGGFVGFWSGVATGRAGRLMDYCRRIEGGEEATAQSSSEEGGGCVWKGRSYGPGESIYHTDGPIRSSDLTVHGDSFEQLSGRSGPWQQCQCSSSSGTWGCV